MSQILIGLSLQSCDTVVHNSRILFNKQFTVCSNYPVSWYVSLGI